MGKGRRRAPHDSTRDAARRAAPAHDREPWIVVGLLAAFLWIAYGFAVRPQEAWDIVNYVRKLQREHPTP